MADETKLSVTRSHISIDNRFLIGVIADEETTIGFLMAGIGEVVGSTQNYFIVSKETDFADIEKFFFNLYYRKDMGAILIGSDLFPKIMQLLSKAKYKKNLPILLEIPTRKTIVENIASETDDMGNTK